MAISLGEGGVCPGEGCLWTEGMAHACENIIFPQFTGGNHMLTCFGTVNTHLHQAKAKKIGGKSKLKKENSRFFSSAFARCEWALKCRAWTFHLFPGEVNTTRHTSQSGSNNNNQNSRNHGSGDGDEPPEEKPIRIPSQW